MKLRVLAFAAVLALLGVLLFVLTRPDDARASVVPNESVDVQDESQDEAALEPVELAGDTAEPGPSQDRATLADDGPWNRWIVPLDSSGAPLATFEVAVVARDGSRTTHASDEALVRDLVPAGGVLVVVADGHCPRFVDVDRLRELGEGPHELPLAPSATVRLTANTESPWYRDVLFVQVGAKARRQDMPANRLVYARFREEAGVVLPPDLAAKAEAQRDGDPYTLFALALQELARPEGSADDRADAIGRAQASRYYKGATTPLEAKSSGADALRGSMIAPQSEVWSARRATAPFAVPLELDWVLAEQTVVVDAAAAGWMRMTGPEGSFELNPSLVLDFDGGRHAAMQQTLRSGEVGEFRIEFLPYAEVRGRIPRDATEARYNLTGEERDGDGDARSSFTSSSWIATESGAFTTGPIVPGFYVFDLHYTAADGARVQVRESIDLTEGGVHDMGLVDGEDGPTLVIEPHFFDPVTGRTWTLEDGIGELHVGFILSFGRSGLKSTSRQIGVPGHDDPTRPIVIRGLQAGEMSVRLGRMGPRDAAFLPDDVPVQEVALEGEVHVPIEIPLRRLGTAHVVVASPVPIGERAMPISALSSRPDGSNRRYHPLDHVPGTDRFEGEVACGAGPLRIDAIWTDTLAVDGMDDVHRFWAASQLVDVRAGESNRIDLQLGEAARALLPAHVLPDTPQNMRDVASWPMEVELFLADHADGMRLGQCTEWIDGRPHVVGLLPNRPYRFRSERDRDVWIEFVTGGPGSLVTVDE
jgi:hypothetical protein